EAVHLEATEFAIGALHVGVLDDLDGGSGGADGAIGRKIDPVPSLRPRIRPKLPERPLKEVTPVRRHVAGELDREIPRLEYQPDDLRGRGVALRDWHRANPTAKQIGEFRLEPGEIRRSLNGARIRIGKFVAAEEPLAVVRNVDDPVVRIELLVLSLAMNLVS